MSSDDDQFDPSSEIHSQRQHIDQPSSEDIRNEDDSEQPEQSESINSYDDEEQSGTVSASRQNAMQRDLLKQAISNEQRRKPFQKQIMSDLIDKLKLYDDAARDKDGEQLVTLRIQQLVYNKMLVLTYGCSEFRLVLSHFHLGSAYLKHQCIEQAIQHISIALHKNQKLFQQLPNTKQFHCIMYNILAECLMKKQQYDDAIDTLQKSIQLQQANHQELGQSAEVVNRSRVLLAQCYTKHSNYNEAIRIIQKVLEQTKQAKSEEEYAFALVEKANILASNKKYDGAVASQEEAINILIKNNYPKPQDVAEMYAKLGDYFEFLGNPENSLACIQKVKTLYQQIYSGEDKRVIKTRRKIATSLLKNQRFKQAVNELLQIIELEQKIFGESSLQTARTLKLLGTVYMRLETGDARTYLKRAMSIFNAHSNKKQVDEIKQKLKILMQTNNNNNEFKILSQQDL